MTSQFSDWYPKDFGQDQGDTDIPIRGFLLSQEIADVEERTINTIVWYFCQMKELKELHPTEICTNDTKKSGSWARPYIDEKPSQKSQAPMKGHLKDGVAHGIGLIRAGSLQSKTYKGDQSFIYIGTFVNGMMHGYGKLIFVQSKSTYEGEFLDGLPHGQGKWTEPLRTLDKLNAKKNNLDIAENFLQTKEGLWEYGSIVPQSKIKESQRLSNLAKWSERQDKLVAEHKELLKLQKEAEKVQDAKIKQERRAWEEKRELERVNEQPFVIKNRLQFFKGLETYEGTGIYPEQNLKKLQNADQSRKSLQQEENLTGWTPANQDFFQQDRHLRLVFKELYEAEVKLISYCDKIEKFSNSDDPSEVKKRKNVKYQGNSLSDIPKDEFKEQMKFINEKLYSAVEEKKMPDIQEKEGSFWNPYYFPAEKKHNWVRENIQGMRYASFDQVEKYIFPEETGQQNKERRENEDDVRAKAVSFKFFVYIMVLNILSYMLYHGFYSWISPDDRIEYEHRYNVTEVCQGETLFQNLTSSDVHALKILPKDETGKRQISIDGQVIGTKVCIKGNEGRGVIFRSLENDMFNQVNGSIFSVTNRGRIEQWYTARNKHDNGATEPRPSFVNWAIKDQEFEDYGNREVNLGSDINTDRGSEFIIIDSEKMVHAEDDELNFLFCKEIFYMSDFFIFLFAYTLLMWAVYSAYGTFKAFRTFGKQAKSPKAVSSIMVLVLYTYDFVKDYQLLITQEHHWSFIGLYSFTIAFAIVYNMYQSRIIHFALRERGIPVLKERTPGKYTYWRIFTDPGQPIEDIGEFTLFVRSFKSQMGFNFDIGDRDQAQKRYSAEAILKQYENIPQIMLVLSESFIGGKTIMFVQLFNPTFGLIMSVATFAAQAGHLFKAETDYIYFSEFIFTTPKQLDLKTENEIAFHKGLKKSIMETTNEQKPEEWQSISRLNSGSMLVSNAFNVQDQDKVLNKLLFRSKKYTREEKIIRGLENILFTQGFLLVLFIILFKLFLNPETEVKALIENQMVVDPAGINDWWFQVFRSYSHLILGFLLVTPTILIVIVRGKLLLKERRQKRFEIKEDRNLTEPLLDKNQSIQVYDDLLGEEEKLPAQECNHCGHKLQDIKYFDKIQQMKLAYVKCKVEKDGRICQNTINMQCSNFSNCKTMVCYDCAKGRYKMQEDEVIETTANSIRIQMSQRAEFTYRGLLKIEEKCDKIAIKANWFNSDPKNRSQLYLQLRKVVDSHAQEEDDPQTGSEDEDDGQKDQGEPIKKGSLLASLQKSLGSKVEEEMRAQEKLEKQKYRSGGPKKIQYLWDGDLKIQVITQELFGMFDNSLNQTDMLLGKESIIVQRMEPGDYIQFSQKSDGAQFQQIRNSKDYWIDLTNLNLILSLELKLAKSQDKIQPLFKYHCPHDPKHSVKPFYQRFVEGSPDQKQEETFIDDPRFSKLVRKMSNKEEVADLLNSFSDAKIQTKYFCFDCNKPISESCVFQERVLVQQPKKDVSAVKPLEPVPTRVVKEKSNVKVQDQFTEKALEDVQTELKVIGQETLEEFNKLSLEGLRNLKGLKAPSPALKNIGDMILILFSDDRNQQGWQGFTDLAANPRKLLDDMINFDKENIDQWRIDLLKPYFSQEGLTKEKILSASGDAWFVYVWATGIVRYNMAYKKQEHLLEQKREIEETIRLLEESADTVTQIDQGSIAVVKNVKNFDGEVTQQVCTALLLMFGLKMEKLRELINNPYFLAKLKGYDKQSVSEELLQQLRPIVNGKAFEIDNLKNTSMAITALGMWIKNIYIYATNFNKLRDQESELVKNWMKNNSKSQNVVYLKQELEKALNDMEKHKEAMNCLRPIEVNTVLGLSNPSESVIQVLRAILCLIGNKRKFETKTEINNTDKGAVYPKMVQLDCDNIDQWRMELVEPIVKSEDFTPEIIQAKCVAAVGMTTWVIQIYNYHKRLQDAKALEEKINTLQNS